jgi:hypothetical protein
MPVVIILEIALLAAIITAKLSKSLKWWEIILVGSFFLLIGGTVIGKKANDSLISFGEWLMPGIQGWFS